MAGVTHIRREMVDVLHQWTSSKPIYGQASLPWPRSWGSLQLLPANWHRSCIALTDYCAMQFLALSFSAHVLRRLHEHTSTLSPVAEHHVNPPLPVTAHCQQHRIRSVWLLCCLAMVAMETFFKGGLGQKRNVERNNERGKRRWNVLCHKIDNCCFKSPAELHDCESQLKSYICGVELLESFCNRCAVIRMGDCGDIAAERKFFNKR